MDQTFGHASVRAIGMCHTCVLFCAKQGGFCGIDGACSIFCQAAQQRATSKAAASDLSRDRGHSRNLRSF